MGMRINQNIAAMNSYRNLSVTEGQFSKSLEKLSSGFRINRAADDAAGLAISEKLRGQVSGLNQASANAQNGISLIQTAEGALNESHSILQRMRELAVQSANDTNTSDDRKQIQKEVNQLSQELSRIGSTTEFNTKKLLDGSAEGGLTFQIGANEGQSLSVKMGDARGFALGVTGAVTSSVTTTTYPLVTAGATATNPATGTDGALADGGYTVSADGLSILNSAGTAVLTSTDSITFKAADTNRNTGDDATYTFDRALTAGEAMTVSGSTATVEAVYATTGGTTTTTEVTGTNSQLEAGTYSVAADGSVTDAGGAAIGTYDATTGSVVGTDGATQLASFAAGTALAGNSFEVAGVDVSSSAATASAAITQIQEAIDKVSDQRSTLGSVQNRLDHTINNLGVAAENLAASESRIRDTDMAAEMMKFTRAQILTQAGTSMLAQANQAPQGVLSLLR